MLFETGDRVIFIGDSITDSGRRQDSEGIGDGYVRMIRDYLHENASQFKLEIINKGISGNRVSDLASRWEEDVLELQPDWVSVSIGINDVWRQLDRPSIEQIYPKQFEEIYMKLLTQLKEKTKAKIILMEPTIIEEEEKSEGNHMLIPYVEAVRRLAESFNAILVSTNKVFLEHLHNHPDVILTKDGVHMNDSGNKLMVETWLNAIK
ncbi:SGNH/GDSL hydrolase family protein [Rossellomorea vietnamensis]|nr:SGNH/GDSL hydrolase family protein [Rossellomorea vietnamensis]